MSQFHIFSKAVHEQFVAMQTGLLFTVNIDGDALYEHYLAAFPKGTNEIYRERTEHDCSCCKNFIRNIGNVVSIDAKTGALITVWDRIEGMPHPYDEVSAIMGSIVRTAVVDSLFQCDMPNYGSESTVELREGQTHRWNHFFSGPIDARHFDKNQAGTRRGKFNTDRGVFERALKELTPDAVATVLDLISADNLYRGTEAQASVTGFQALQNSYLAKKVKANRHHFTFLNASQHGALIRNTAIGTLLQDLSEGKPLDAAVKSYEDKVSGTNYKRPKALVTPAMVNAAMATIQELGVEPSLERRFAKASDVNVNDILFVDGALRSQMKGGLGNMLMAAAKQKPAVVSKTAQDITIDELMKMLPQVTGLELLVENRHQGNFVSLTAPVHADVEPIFKWPNNFAWSYDGNVTDTIRERVKAAGGRVEGAALRVSLAWNNTDDLDLHVFEPNGHCIYFSNRRRKSALTGMLDVDANGMDGIRTDPVENITWDRMTDGEYRIVVNNYSRRSRDNQGFTLEVDAGAMQHFSCETNPETREDIEALTLVVRGGQIIETRKHPSVIGAAFSQEKWGIKTQDFTRVDTLMLSPNYWGDSATGNKHFIFVLDGCKNPAPTRGIYNEFLKPELEKHRKVFELLGSKTMCPVTDEQLSGVGFSATKKDKVTVRINGGRLYNVAF